MVEIIIDKLKKKQYNKNYLGNNPGLQ